MCRRLGLGMREPRECVAESTRPEGEGEVGLSMLGASCRGRPDIFLWIEVFRTERLGWDLAGKESRVREKKKKKSWKSASLECV